MIENAQRELVRNLKRAQSIHDGFHNEDNWIVE